MSVTVQQTPASFSSYLPMPGMEAYTGDSFLEPEARDCTAEFPGLFTGDADFAWEGLFTGDADISS